MGRATRWFKGLFGIKTTTKENVGDGYLGDGRTNAPRAAAGMCNNPATIPPNITPAEAAWVRSFFNDTDKDHSKHAIAVAAATAAAADAAVAAAQAAVAVVRLTSQQGRGGGGSNSYTANTASFGGREKYLAALKIQNVFRGFLARKALRALKGLVKIQALVRGFLVRKQAAATLYSMQALIRAQASVRAQRNQSLINVNISTKHHPARNSAANQHEDPRSQELSRRLSASLEPTTSTPMFDQESPKIVEVDTGSKARISKSRRSNSWMTNPESVDVESLTIPHRFNHTNPSSRLLVPDERDNNYWDEERCHFSTAQSTPRIARCGCEHGLITASKSVGLDGSYNEDDKLLLHPSYMAKTVSSKAKLRSRSVPRQRPDGGFSKRRLSLHEIMESTRNSLRMERSCSNDQRAAAFKNAVTGKIGKSSDYFLRN